MVMIPTVGVAVVRRPRFGIGISCERCGIARARLCSYIPDAILGGRLVVEAGSCAAAAAIEAPARASGVDAVAPRTERANGRRT